MDEDVFFDAGSDTEAIFHEVEELPPVTLSDLKIEFDDWRVHILKQIKANRSQGYNKFGRSLYEEGLGQAVEINVFVEEGDEIRMYGPDHLTFELLKRGKSPAEDKSYTFGFGPESMEQAHNIDQRGDQRDQRGDQRVLTALGMVALPAFNDRAADAVSRFKIPLGVGSAVLLGLSTAVSLYGDFITSHRGCFFSPDPSFETQIKLFLTEKGEQWPNFVLGTCKIEKDLLSQKLAAAMNRLFQYVNSTKIKVLLGYFKDKSPYINMIVPQKWGLNPMKCRKTENCASYFQTMLGDELIHCVSDKLSFVDPKSCKFAKQLSCEDCETRDFSYISGDKFGGKKSKKRRTLTLKKKGGRRGSRR